MAKNKPKTSYRERQMELTGRCDPPPLPKHYSIARIKKLFKEIYDLDVIRITTTNYKSREYYSHYKVVDDTGTIVISCASVYALGTYLDREGEYNG